MKKKFYFATLVIALLTFTGCANDEYVGDQQNLGEQNGAIAFSTKSENTVRGTTQDPNAPAKLNTQFWVYGWKTVKDDSNIDKEQIVFNGYKVVYQGSTASSSNTRGWEYVGIEGTDPAQTIKYWDYSASQYDFEAYSFYTTSQGTVARNTTSTENGLALGDYIVENVNENECANLYFADKMTVNKTSTTTGPKYGDPVTLTFKSVLSKIRVGFYETIPGYSVEIDGFYGPNADATDFVADGSQDNSQFVAWCPNKKIDGNMSFVVRYGTENNNATPAITKVKKDNDYQEISSAGSNGGYTLNPTLTLGGECLNKTIGTQSSKVTWDQYEVNYGPSKYTYVIPQDGLYNSSEENSQVKAMKIKVDYTLTSTDGTNEPIHVKGATAIVPKEYLQWAPNTAYSYVFKISDNTNGNTGTPGTNPAGLYPITFDAVVEDMAEYKDHLTTVSDLSITATQGKQFAEADKAVFKTGQDIKVKVMYNNVDRTSNVGANSENGDSFQAAFVNSYDFNKSPEQNLTDSGKSLEQKNLVPAETVIKLGSQNQAGFWIVKVTFKETTNDVNRDITKYAVLKVGTDTTTP